MTDEARAQGAGDEDRLPWLEAVEEDEQGGGPPLAKLVAAIVIGLVAIGIVVGGLFWLGNRGGEGGGDGELIAAPEGDYKVKPAEPGGMDVADRSGTAQSAAQGAEPRGRLDADAVPETPVTPGAQPQPKAAPAQPQRPPAQPPRTAPAAPGATVQLGAFSSQAAAQRAWTGLSGRFGYLSPLTHSIVPVESGGRRLYRLRASGPGAADICRRLRIAGEACEVVG